MPEKEASKAASPPAEAPMPTTGNPDLTSPVPSRTSGAVETRAATTGAAFDSFAFPLFFLGVMIASLRPNASARLPGKSHTTEIAERNDQGEEKRSFLFAGKAEVPFRDITKESPLSPGSAGPTIRICLFALYQEREGNTKKRHAKNDTKNDDGIPLLPCRGVMP